MIKKKKRAPTKSPVKGRVTRSMVRRLIEEQEAAEPRPESATSSQDFTRYLGGTTIARFVNASKEQARLEALEIAERRRWQEQTLEQLRAINLQAGQVAEAPDEDPSLYRTGAPGRPGSSHLVLPEFRRRVKRGKIEETVGQQGVVLAAWLKKAYPKVHPITAKTAETTVRTEYWQARAKARRQSPQKE